MKDKSKKNHLIDKMVLSFNIVLAVLLVVSYLAPFADPRKFFFIALLGFVYQFLVVCNLPFVVYWGFRKPVFMLISLITFLIGFNTIKAHFGFNGNTTAAEKSSQANIRVMQYNVRRFYGIGAFNGQRTKTEILDIIKNEQPDLLSMEEFSIFKKSQDTAILSLVRQALHTQYSYFKYFKIMRRHEYSGNAIYSKYPIVNTGWVLSEKELGTRAIYADVKINNETIRFYSIHLKAVVMNSEAKQQVLDGNISIDSSGAIMQRLKTAFVTRSVQVAQIKKHISTCPYPYIIAGDLNDTPNSFAVTELGKGLKSAFIQQGRGLVTTFYSIFPLQIDQLLVSPEFDILNYRAIDKEISDHKPIVSDLKLKL